MEPTKVASLAEKEAAFNALNMDSGAELGIGNESSADVAVMGVFQADATGEDQMLSFLEAEGFGGFKLTGNSKLTGVTLETCQDVVFQASYRQALGSQLEIPAVAISITGITAGDTVTEEAQRRLGTEVTIDYTVDWESASFLTDLRTRITALDMPALTTAIKVAYEADGGDRSLLSDLSVGRFTSLPTFAVIAPAPTTDTPTYSPTEVIVGSFADDILSTPDLNDFDAGGIYHLGGHVVVADPGTFYTEGEEVLVGAGNPGWTTPAKLVVTSVDEAGGVIDLDVKDGGLYTGDRGSAPGDYDLTPVEASLLLKARSSSPATAQTKTKKSDLSASEYRTVGIIGVASSLLALVAIVVLVSRRRGAPALHNIVQEAATTPAADTAADAL